MGMISEIKKRWEAETPKIARNIKYISAIIMAVVPPAWGVVMSMTKMSDAFSDEMTKTVGLITFVSAIVTFYCGMQTKEGDKKNEPTT